MISYIVESTNEYAILKNLHLLLLSMKYSFFLGFIIYMSISSLPVITMFCSKDSAYFGHSSQIGSPKIGIWILVKNSGDIFFILILILLLLFLLFV